jgi:prepilin-type N-terminal cleavage/methylation domain-containing protein
MNNRGYTLIEMVLVIVIIGILAGIAVQSLNTSDQNRRLEETIVEMEDIGRAIAGDERLITDGTRTDFGYVGDVGSLPSNLDDLVANPGGYSTWDGPYIRNNFNENSEDYKRDAWNNPYVYAGGVSISSSAGGEPITRQFAGSVNELTSNTIKGIIRDKGGLPPGDAFSDVNIVIYFPNGAGSVTGSPTIPSRSGEFSFDNQIPVGIHLIRAVDNNSGDSASKYIAVNPGSKTLTELRMPSNLWGTPGGGGGGVLEYVPGTALAYGPGNRNMSFDIVNNGTAAVTVSSVVLVFDIMPPAYYQRVLWDGQNVYNNQRLASGESAVFSGPRTINQAQVLTICFENFWDEPSGGGSFVNVSGIDFQVIFPNGDTVSFTTP